MKTWILISLLLPAILLSRVQARDFPAMVEVFKQPHTKISSGKLTKQMERAAVPLSVYQLSDPVEFKYSQNLQDQITTEQVDQIALAMMGHTRAQMLRVTYLPAIVFDGQFVVYGVRDMDYALDIWMRR